MKQLRRADEAQTQQLMSSMDGVAAAAAAAADAGGGTALDVTVLITVPLSSCSIRALGRGDFFSSSPF